MHNRTALDRAGWRCVRDDTAMHDRDQMPITAEAISFASSNSGLLNTTVLPGCGPVTPGMVPGEPDSGMPSSCHVTPTPTRPNPTIATATPVHTRSHGIDLVFASTSVSTTSSTRVSSDSSSSSNTFGFGDTTVKRRLSRCAEVCPRTNARMPALSAVGTPRRSITTCSYPPLTLLDRPRVLRRTAGDERFLRRQQEPIGLAAFDVKIRHRGRRGGTVPRMVKLGKGG